MCAAEFRSTQPLMIMHALHRIASFASLAQVDGDGGALVDTDGFQTSKTTRLPEPAVGTQARRKANRPGLEVKAPQGQSWPGPRVVANEVRSTQPSPLLTPCLTTHYLLLTSYRPN